MRIDFSSIATQNDDKIELNMLIIIAFDPNELLYS